MRKKVRVRYEPRTDALVRFLCSNIWAQKNLPVSSQTMECHARRQGRSTKKEHGVIAKTCRWTRMLYLAGTIDASIKRMHMTISGKFLASHPLRPCWSSSGSSLQHARRRMRLRLFRHLRRALARRRPRSAKIDWSCPESSDTVAEYRHALLDMQQPVVDGSRPAMRVAAPQCVTARVHKAGLP